MEENFLSQLDDKLELAIKSDVLDKTKKWYTVLGWTITEEVPDKFYTDITHLSLTRPHKIANKDRLQLLQVRIEMLANLIARIERRIIIYSGLWSAGLFLLGAAIVACGVLLCMLSSGAFYLICGIVIIVSGVLFWVVSAFVGTQMHEKYLEEYKPYNEILQSNIKEILAEASALTGFAYADKE